MKFQSCIDSPLRQRPGHNPLHSRLLPAYDGDMPQPLTQTVSTLTRRWLIGGIVQGVGFRPFVARLARRHSLRGWVRNQHDFVEIVGQGTAAQLQTFEAALFIEAPAISRPQLLRHEDYPVELDGDFAIFDSATDTLSQSHLLPDLSICDSCLQELNDPANRRYRHPFIACSECGPRYTTLHTLPYERENTSLKAFPLCSRCREEYFDPSDRRFYAQTINCSDCGPQLTFRHYVESRAIAGNTPSLAACIDALRNGEVIAVKGIGGYHLLCDAYNNEAVTRLRTRKRRPEKPFAVLYPRQGNDGLAALRPDIEFDDISRRCLLNPQCPIVLLPRLGDSRLAIAIAPGLNEIGVMLPYSPLHQLIADGVDGPLVATSANLSGEPVLCEEHDVNRKLQNVADAVLHHNRAILRPADDSVYRIIGKQPRPIRLGRGIAPLELDLPWAVPRPILALGGHLKTTLTLAWENRAVISPHIGNLGNPAALDLLIRLSRDFQELYQVNAEIIVCDQHPGFMPHEWATALGCEIKTVLHHHAHASALLGEHAHNDDALVFTWDGMGFGDDQTLWGGETLLGKPGCWNRIGSFRPWRLQGGDRAAREPWRSAAALCWELGLSISDNDASRLVHHAWQKNLNCNETSAVGRLFDAAAAMLELCEHANYEGQGAMLLEHACAPVGHPITLPINQNDADIWRCDWRPLVAMLQRREHHVSRRAADFHATLAYNILAQSRLARSRYNINVVGLTGGVFQNKRLTEEAVDLLKADGFQMLLSERIPCNDAGLSFGQTIEAIHRITA